MILQNIISQNNSDIILNPISLNIPPEVLTPTTFYWFKVYNVADFPGLDFDTSYIFLYSTNHDSGDGGIYLGKGNKLDLSDYQELGLVFDGYQAETPVLWYNSGHERPIHLFYHTDDSDPANGGIQQTRLKTTAGGDLITSTWTQETNPLGSEVGDLHTGYFNFWYNGMTFKGVHYKQGINEATGYIGQQQYSTFNGTSWVRGDIVDTTSYLEPERLAQIGFGIFFYKYNQWWWIGLTRQYPLTSHPNQTVLCRANSNFEITDFVQVLYETGQSPVMYIEGNVMHIYFTSYNRGIYYTTFSLTQLVEL